MKIYVGQIYIKPGVSFPFSHLMQGWLSEELSSVSNSSSTFERKHGQNMDLIVRVSADTGLLDNRIKGPTVFKKDNDVEYTLFLPYDVIAQAKEGRRTAAQFLIAGIRSIFCQAGVDTEQLDQRASVLIEHLASDPTMLAQPWPGS